MKIGGILLVSEPPDDNLPSRWSKAGLARLGLRDHGRVRSGAAFQIVEKVRETEVEYPRPIGIPKKKPLF
jgi:hypothetical protein